MAIIYISNFLIKLLTGTKWIFYFSIVFFLTLSCEKDFDTNLRGKWQLQREITTSKTVIIDTIFYNFDNHVFQIQTKTDEISYTQILGRFTQHNDSLFFDFVNNSNIPAKHYFIKKLSSNILQLKNINIELQFRKF